MSATDPRHQACPPSLRPSEYTAALIKVLQATRDSIAGVRAVEVGCGSGVVLAAIASFGARAVCGIDIEPEAASWTSALLTGLGHADRTVVHCGDLWQPVAGERFDLIAANLPHFPMEPMHFGDRRPSWGYGGADGRRLLDPFLEGLGSHLDAGGRALITHNGFVDLERTRAILRRTGLGLSVVDTIVVYVPQEKFDLMTPSVLKRERDRSIFQFGPYAFAHMHIVQISAAPEGG